MTRPLACLVVGGASAGAAARAFAASYAGRCELVAIGGEPPRDLPFRRVELESPSMDPLAFQCAAHARSDAVLQTLRALERDGRLEAVMFDDPADAFAASQAAALSGELDGCTLIADRAARRTVSFLQDREALIRTGLGELAGRWLEARQAAGATPARAGSAPGPLVSVVVPHFNLGAFLPDAIASIRASTWPEVEIVVVDDGSTEPLSRAVFRNLAGPRLKLVEKPNGGLASARNAGLAVARGELILPLDADDLIDPTYVARAVEAHQRAPGLAFVTCHAAFFRDRPGDMGGEGYAPVGLHGPSLLLGNVASTCSAVFRRSALEEAGGWDESWPSYEDWDLYCRMAERGAVAGVLPRALFHYRWRARSMVRTTALERDRELRSRMIRSHPVLAERHAVDALLAHVAASPFGDARVLPRR